MRPIPPTPQRVWRFDVRHTARIHRAFALAALVGLPLLYYLLRVTPPRPRQVPFPPLRLFFDLIPANQTPRRTPPWLLILRLAIAACIILAMAGPVLNPAPLVVGAGPLLIVLDDGWPAAPSFSRRIEAAAQRIEAAGRRWRPVAVVATSDGPREIVATDAAKALDRLRAINPAPLFPIAARRSRRSKALSPRIRNPRSSGSPMASRPAMRATSRAGLRRSG